MKTVEDIEQRSQTIQNQLVQNGRELKRVEEQISETQLLIKNLSNYQKTKSIHEEYLRTKKPEEFKSATESELIIYAAAAKALEKTDFAFKESLIDQL